MQDSKLIIRLREKLADEDMVDASRQRILIDVAQLDEWYEGTYGQPMDPDDIGLTSADLADFRTHVLRTCQASTCSRKLASIRTMLRLLAPTVLTSLRMPKLPPASKAAPSGWTRKERLSILRAVSKLGVRDRAICMTLIWTGARSSSVAGLKLSGVKLATRSGSLSFDVIKGAARGGRTVTVPANVELRDALADWIRVRPPVKHDALFTAEKWPYEGITRWTVHDVWHRRLAKHLPQELAAKLKGPHQARHALARLLLDQGVPLPDVAAILGHASVATTANIYCRPSEADLRKHLDRAVGEDVDE